NSCDSFWKDEVIDEKIRLRAYQNWESSGRHFGDSLMYWQQAEKDFMD
ncbi:MAG: DUF2934 domain-containing protein, partial [Arcicella sp.]|nr:DUF2934 domain-containing protein [Arcicella sp.]